MLKEAGASPRKTHRGKGPMDPQGTIRGSVYKARIRIEGESDRKMDVNLSEQCHQTGDMEHRDAMLSPDHLWSG